MRRDWRAAWYQANPEGLVGRLRDLARSRPEAAHALITRLEKEGWVGLGEDLRAPRALCPVCRGEGVVWTHPMARSWEVPQDLADEWWEDCPECGGEGLVPFPAHGEAEEEEVPVEVVVSLLMREVADSGPNGQEARGNGQ